MSDPVAHNPPSLTDTLRRDHPALERQWRLVQRRYSKGQPCDRAVAQLEQMLAQSRDNRQRRDQASLNIAFDPALPISAHIDEIVAALATHQVLIVAGETGSGKTTQLPKACWLAGGGRNGWIGCTQPRRIAARTIAARLAEELEVKPGVEVGYQVRFDQQVTDDSLIKVMTDGILLAETQRDRDLVAYDTLIIDEAHERSLNIDFLLGYLKRLLPRRPDLKVIITSATIDTARFAEHFDNAPIIEVSGRSFPVEMRYRPLQDEKGESSDLNEAIAAAVGELNKVDARGDMLVFLPGERDIREASEHLAGAGLRNTEILPLYSRLSRSEQNLIFHPGAARRIVLTTNVAETSLTVPRIQFVIDSGLARISRYSHRTKVQRLPIEPISQASANQRAGRCGRLGPGVCIRLYGEDDFLNRPEYTDPEILRTNLAAVILQMALLKLGAVEDYPFLQPPQAKFIRDGFALLFELRAIDASQQLTKIGREMARWPLDVRMARLVLAGQELGCANDALVLAGFLSLADPRERPLEAQQAADEKHRQWQDDKSDLSTVLNLWDDWRTQRKQLGGAALRRWCREQFLSYPRMREWHDIWRQLTDQLAEQSSGPARKKQPDKSAKENAKPSGADARVPLHRAFVSAFLGHVGVKQESGYLGVRDRRYDIFPGSGLFGRGPKWMVSAFLVETSKLYARLNAAIDPRWVEQAAGHLLKKRRFDPAWSEKDGRVVGYEQVTLYGLVLVPQRRIHFGPHDPQTARDIMIRDGLVPGRVRTRAAFANHNAQLLQQLDSLEQRCRRRDLRVSDEQLARFFAGRMPAEIHTARALENWLKDDAQNSLHLTLDDVMNDTARAVTYDDYPSALHQRGVTLKISYRLAPGATDDGATVTLPLHMVNLLRPEPLEWLIPGWLRDKVIALIKTLPKPKRRAVVPAPDFADAFLARQHDKQRSLISQLADFLKQDTQVQIRPQDFAPEQLEPWLNFRLVVVDGERKVEEGRDLASIQQRWAEAAEREFIKRAQDELKVDSATTWDFAVLPETTRLEGDIKAWPALVDQENAVGVRVFDTASQAAVYHRFGLRRLLILALGDKLRYLKRHLGVDAKLALKYVAVDSAPALEADLLFAVTMSLVDSCAEPVRDAQAFADLVAGASGQLLSRAQTTVALVADALERFHELRRRLDEELEKFAPTSVADMREQLEFLVYPGFLTEVSMAALEHYPRYLEALALRIERLQADPQRDRQRHGQISGFWDQYVQHCEASNDYPPELDQFHWLLEEYRVSLFAQELKTAMPVSAKKLKTAWRKVTDP